MKTKQSLKTQFKEAVKGTNFMTPDIIEYIKIDNGVVELSKGKGIFSDTIYGVTVVRYGKKNSNLSNCFTKISDARDYIETLK